MNVLNSKLSALPSSAGVYIMKDESGRIIYVGKAKNLKNRVSQYFFSTQKMIKVQNMVDKIRDIDYYVVQSENDAFALESNLIKKYQPFYNILLKDNKAYQYIKIDLNREFPRFELTRRLQKGAKYFGPYFGGVRANELLEVLSYAYPLIKCGLNITSHSKAIRPCLFYDLHLCSAPCAHYITAPEYKEVILAAIKFLKGDTSKIEGILREKMAISSESANYETAIKLRDALKMLTKLTDQVITQLTSPVNYDVFDTYVNGDLTALCVMVVRGGKLIGINSFAVRDYSLSREEFYSNFLMTYYDMYAYTCDTVILPVLVDDVALSQFIVDKYGVMPHFEHAQRGIKHKLLQTCVDNAKLHIEKNVAEEEKRSLRTTGALVQLQKQLGLSRLPYRIECYDISNTSGTDTVASMSVLLGGEKAPKHYRKFKIKTVEYIDDFASMSEVLRRRFGELGGGDISFSSSPDLILIDGGKGQLSSVMTVAGECGYTGDIVSLAKRLEEVFVPNNTASIRLPYGSYALRMLQLARDEAHRTAITYNRLLRSKTAFKGGLIGLDHIGPATRRKLLATFKTLDNIGKADMDTLTKAGLSTKQANSVYQHYHKEA